MVMHVLSTASSATMVARCTAVKTNAVAPAVVFQGRRAFFQGTKVAPTTPMRVRFGPNNTRVQALFGGAAVDNKTFYDYTVTDIDGKSVNLSQYKGKLVLVVNVASQCGFTPQYKSLQGVFSKYSKDGLVVLAFPCNQFGGQEPGSNNEVKAFAARQGATFPMMAKVDVNGANADPLFGFLKSKQGGLLTSDIKWNFTKFLVDREGAVVKRYGSTTTPEEIEADIKQYL